MRTLLITPENAARCPQLASFLSGCHAQPRVVDDRSVVVDLDDEGCPGLATLVAELEQWRSYASAGEVSLALGDEVRVLRTEA